MNDKFYIDVSEAKEGEEIFNGVLAIPIYLDKQVMAIKVVLENDVPNHKHPHFQMGIAIKGKALFKIDGEERIVSENVFYAIPSNIEHEVKIIEKPFIVIDFFIPPREDYLRLFKD